MRSGKTKRNNEAHDVGPASKVIKLETKDLKPVIKIEPIIKGDTIKKELPLQGKPYFHNSNNSKLDECLEGKNTIKKDTSFNYSNNCHMLNNYSEPDKTIQDIKAISSRLFKSYMEKENFCEEKDWLVMEVPFQKILKFLETDGFKSKGAEKGLGKDFVLKLTEMIPKAGALEIPLVLKILRQTYTKLVHLRKIIREEFIVLLKGVIKVGEAPGWVSNLLGLVASIIKGLEVPLKIEHVLFFQGILLPLHKVHNLSTFHAQLISCTTFFIKKDPELCHSAVGFLRELWSNVEADTQMILLDEIRDIACLLNDEVSNCRSIVTSIFVLIADCFSTCDSQKVLEKSLYFWSKTGPEKLLREKIHIIMPIVFQSVRGLTKSSDSLIVGLAYNVLKILMDTDPQLFKQLRIRK
ncbi:unnamed protein product [Allacma fusca]|uniref:Uncharacterized protein n=1 Tax=Allacma fusca TaxID=39272 RepID=A0A8J2NJ14_9HEXA|nr:unnamed protein product [Allacma fusca]